MALLDVLRRLKGLGNGYVVNPPFQRPAGMPADYVPDKKLENLRRMRKAQLQEVEKRRLQVQIRAYQQARESKGIVGKTPFKQGGFGLDPSKNLIMRRKP